MEQELDTNGRTGVDIPLVLHRPLLSQNGNLEHHLLPESVIGHDEILQQLVDDGSGVGAVTHRVEQVERSSSDRDVAVSEGEDDGLLVLLNWLKRVGAGGEVSHRVESEVPDVGLFAEDEPAQEDRSSSNDVTVGVRVDGEVDGFEEDRVLCVGVLDVLWRVARRLEDLGEDVLEGFADRCGGGRRVVLKKTEELDLKPGNRNSVVVVVRRVALVKDEL